MERASASRTIKFITKAGTYTAQLLSPSGDLMQEYQGDAATGYHGITPDFVTLQPKLNFVVLSSRAAETVEVQNPKFFVNGAELQFGSDGVSIVTFPGYFKKTTGTVGGKNCPCLQILKNLVSTDLGDPASVVFRAEGTMSYGTISDVISASYTMPVQKSSGTGYRVTIMAGDDYSFVISRTNESCVLKAMTFRGADVVTEGLTYKWFKATKNGWADTGRTTQSITVTGDNIDTYGLYKVEVYRGTTRIGIDTQSVLDATDPYEVVANPTPEDETIYEDGGNDHVTYAPKLRKRSSGSDYESGTVSYYFAVIGSGGEIINSNDSTAMSEFTVTKAMMQQAQGDVLLVITAEIE